MGKSKRTKVVADTQRACDACPWRKSNHGKRTSGGWYTKTNMRRLWAGLRSGDAPGMTCHPTDPDNPPADDGSQAPEGTQTKECYGALLLIAREMKLAEGLCKTLGDGAVREYRKLRPKGLTRAGLASWVWRFAAGGTPITGPTLPTTFMHDDEIQHPDFEAPDEPE